jgi:hypothetical protein
MYGIWQMSDLLVQAAGVLGIAVALLHGYLGQTQLFAKVPIASRRARRILWVIFHNSVVSWTAVGILLILVPTLGSERARYAIIAASVAIYGSAAIGNAWATRGRHFGWAALSVVIGLAVAGM